MLEYHIHAIRERIDADDGKPRVVRSGEVFADLMETAEYAGLCKSSNALFVAGRERCSM